MCIRDRNRFDAVFLGMQASPEDNGITGALVAEALGLPFINRVYAIRPVESGFSVETPVEGGMRRMEIPGRAVYAFGNAKYSYLRAATLREKLNAASKQAREMVVASEKENPALHVATFRRARPERQVTMLEETLPKKAARMLADTYLSEEMSK